MPIINERHTKIIVDLWREQPGEYFFASTKIAGSAKGNGWKDHCFVRSGNDFVLADGKPEDGIGLCAFFESHATRDLYFCPHGFSKPMRQEICAVPGRLLFADLDSSDPRKLEEKLRPTIAWETSPGRFHGIWIADGVVTNKLNRRLTYATKADKGGWGYTKVLRIPGTYNYKYSTKPIVRVVVFNSMHTVSVKQFEQDLPNFAGAGSDASESATAILKRYKIPASTQQLLLQKKEPDTGKRSEVLFKLSGELLEAGVTPDDVKALLQSSVWNKYADRNDESEQIERTVDKMLTKKLGHGTPGQKRAKVESNFVDAQTHGRDEQPELHFGMVTMAEVQETEIDWLWRPYFARRELTIFEGDPGIGKSYVMQMIAKAVCDGQELPVPSMAPKYKKITGKVLYFDVENDPGSVTKKRLLHAKIINLQNYIQEEYSFTIDDENAMAAVNEACDRLKPDIVVFDTLNTYVGGTDTYKAGEARAALGQFLGIAKTYNAAVVVIRHLTKGKGPAMYRGQGSIALSGTARVVVVVGAVPSDQLENVEGYTEGDDVRALAVTKLNIGKKPPPLAYRITSTPTLSDPDASEFSWGSFIDGLSADDMLNAEAAPTQTASKAGDEARMFLLSSLKGGGIDGAALLTMAETRSISKTTLYRAADRMQEDGLILRPKRGKWELTPPGMKMANDIKK